MGQQIINNLKGTTIGGDYIGGNNINYTEKADVKKNRDKTIFLSYNWHDEQIADKIDKHLSKFPNITVKRDVRDIGTWKSIKGFMKSIRQQDYAVLLISDFYLKSKNCMFEVTEIMKEQEYRDRIFPAVLECSIYEPLGRAKYIEYWQKECEALETAIKGLDLANAAELVNDLKWYKSIASSVGEFLSIVADMNNPNIQEIEIQIEKAVLKNEY